MATQYQTFPGAQGDSRSIEKLKALQFPPLEGKSFLDVGCNEGFFCGFAHFMGATRVVGIDFSADFVRRARARFPDCEFLQQGWEVLPDEKFDVILMASAIHYADDQPAMIRRLLDHLAPGGILILEIGIAQSSKAEWVEVKRSIDTRKFPSSIMLQKELQEISAAWKWMGHSVSQAGDPTPRFVLHISNKKPIAYLLLQPSGYGKTYLSQVLFKSTGVSTLHGDSKIIEVANGQRQLQSGLENLIKKEYAKNNNIARIINSICDFGLLGDLVDLWFADSTSGDVVIDSYIPVNQHKKVIELVEDKGYMAVHLAWNNVISTERGGPTFLDGVDRYSEHLKSNQTSFDLLTDEHFYAHGEKGCLDSIYFTPEDIQISGWAVGCDGQMPNEIVFTFGGQVVSLLLSAPISRPDVQKHLSLNHSLCGFSLNIDRSLFEWPADFISPEISVSFPSGEQLQITSQFKVQLKALKNVFA